MVRDDRGMGYLEAGDDADGGSGEASNAAGGASALSPQKLPGQSGNRKLVNSWPLDVDQLVAGYGGGTVLDRISFRIGAAERVGILGRNGAGKSTLLRALMGLLRARSGRIVYGDEELQRRQPFEIARRGIAYVPQARELFSVMTVEENLRLGAVAHAHGVFAHQAVLSAFPWIESRLADVAGTLSGGHQQQLAIARALMSAPGLLLLDEPLEGLQPSVVEDIAVALRRTGVAWSMSLLLVEQNVDAVLYCCDRVLFMENGAIQDGARCDELLRDRSLIDRYLGL